MNSLIESITPSIYFPHNTMEGHFVNRFKQRGFIVSCPSEKGVIEPLDHTNIIIANPHPLHVIDTIDQLMVIGIAFACNITFDGRMQSARDLKNTIELYEDPSCKFKKMFIEDQIYLTLGI